MADGTRLAALRARPRRDGEASFFYRDPAFGTEAVKVLPGEWFVHDEDIAVLTVLGSCVAACLVDRAAGVGGMNHFLLPEGDESSARYGAFAMEVLINELLKRGARRGALEAKVFGGASMIPGGTALEVGRRNVEFVERYLAAEGIPIVSRDVLGRHARKLVLFPRSGKAMVKGLAGALEPAVLAAERRLQQRVGRVRGGPVELF